MIGLIAFAALTCAGDIQVTVTYGTQTRTERLSLHCGE